MLVVVQYAIGDVGLGQVLARLFANIDFVVIARVDEKVLLIDWRQFIGIVYHQVATDLVVQRRVLIDTEVDHHAKHFVRVEWLIGNVQIQCLLHTLDDGRLG